MVLIAEERPRAALAARLRPPGGPVDLLDRPGVTELIRRSLERPLTLICAPAGFGKTTALAAAVATLKALNTISGEHARFGLDFAVQVLAVGQPYVLAAVAVTSPQLGRRSLPLYGAHPLEQDLETAAALAVLKATNRSLGFLLGQKARRSRSQPAE